MIPGLPLQPTWWPLAPLASLSAQPKAVALGEATLGVLRPAAGALALAGEAQGPLAEAEGWAWLWVGSGEGPSPEAGPSWPQAPRWAAWVEHRSAPMAAPWGVVLENSFDYVHGAHAHPWTQPAWYLWRLPGQRRLVQRYRSRAEGIELEGWAGGKRLSYRHRFIAPATLHLRVGGEALGFDVVAVHVPAGAGTRLAVRLCAPGWGGRVAEGLNAVLAQDARIVGAQAQAAAWDASLGLPQGEAHAPSDAPALLLRAWVQAALAGVAGPGEGPWRELSLHA